MGLRFAQAICLLAYSFTANGAEPFFNSRNPYCPMISGIPWRDYLSGNYETKSPLMPNMVGVKFIFAKKIRDPAAMYNVDPGLCYGVHYIKDTRPGFPKGYLSHRLYGYERRESNEQVAKLTRQKSGLGGDPSKWEINVDSHIFIYNALGEIFDNRGRVVGQMFCYTGNDCGQYKY